MKCIKFQNTCRSLVPGSTVFTYPNVVASKIFQSHKSHCSILFLKHRFSSFRNNTASDLNQKSFSTLLSSQLLPKLMAKRKSFLHHLHCDNGEPSAYWMPYIDLVENIVLGLLCGSSEGDWDFASQCNKKLNSMVLCI